MVVTEMSFWYFTF